MKLTSPRLSVDWAEPGSYYNQSRFDWTSFITQVMLDGTTTFCVPESVDGSGTGGCGLCSEFGIMEPVGFDDCPKGEWFPKIGVGALRRPDKKPYSFARPYEMRQAPVRWERNGRSSVDVAMDSVTARGYAIRLARRIEVEDNRIIVSSAVENVGDKPVATREYAHNFLMVNNGESKDYVLEAPFDLGGWEWPENIAVDGATARWLKPTKGAMYVPLEPLAPGARRFTLHHLPSKTSVTEEDDSDWSKLTVWGTRRVISAEAFIDIRVAPGQMQRWSRTYIFDRK